MSEMWGGWGGSNSTAGFRTQWEGGRPFYGWPAVGTAAAHTVGYEGPVSRSAKTSVRNERRVCDSKERTKKKLINTPRYACPVYTCARARVCARV